MHRTIPLVATILLTIPIHAGAFPATVKLSAPPSDVYVTRANGLAASDNLGFSVSTTGDFNADGVSDFALGAPSAGTSPGSVFVVYGAGNSKLPSPLALDSVDVLRIDGASANAQTGTALASGDVNGDGLHDLVIGAPGESAVYVLLGPQAANPAAINLSVSSSSLLKLQGPSNAQSGYSVSVGDINHDNIADIAIGNGSPNLGAGYVVFGRVGLAGGDLTVLNGNDGIQLGGANVNSSSFAVSMAGDVNGDGAGDLLIGAPDTAVTYVLFGRGAFGNATVNISDAQFASQLQGAASSWFGFSVGGPGDLNGDGLNDIAVGAPLANVANIIQAGKSHVIFGRMSFPAVLDVSTQSNGNGGFQVSGYVTSQRIGWSAAGAGDVNGDGHADLILGAPYDSYTARAAGSAYVIYGKNGGFTDINLNGLAINHLDGSNGFQIAGVGAGDQAGFSVASAGDVDGDSADDLLLGARNAQYGVGAAFLVYGQTPAPLDTTPPSITGSRTPAANTYGWNNSNVTVSFTCSDSQSGINSCTPNVILSNEGAGQSATGTATDNAGNTATATVNNISIDKTVPSVAVTGVMAGMVYSIAPKPGCTASDALSGIAVAPTLAVVKGQSVKGVTSYTATCSGATDKADNAVSPVSVSYQVKTKR